MPAVVTIVSFSEQLDVIDEIFGLMGNQCSSTGLGVLEIYKYCVQWLVFLKGLEIN